MNNFIFYLGMGAIFTHEIDAMPNHEWRVIPLVRMLPDEVGMNMFVVAHVPIFALLIAVVASSIPRTRTISKLVICGFLVLHGVLHASFMGHPDYEFSSILSNALIFGAAAFGGLYLAIEILSNRESAI